MLTHKQLELIEHYAKGSRKPGSKYKSRKMVNGKWVYDYGPQTKSDRDKERIWELRNVWSSNKNFMAGVADGALREKQKQDISDKRPKYSHITSVVSGQPTIMVKKPSKLTYYKNLATRKIKDFKQNYKEGLKSIVSSVFRDTKFKVTESYGFDEYTRIDIIPNKTRIRINSWLDKVFK